MGMARARFAIVRRIERIAVRRGGREEIAGSMPMRRFRLFCAARQRARGPRLSLRSEGVLDAREVDERVARTVRPRPDDRVSLRSRQPL